MTTDEPLIHVTEGRGQSTESNGPLVPPGSCGHSHLSPHATLLTQAHATPRSLGALSGATWMLQPFLKLNNIHRSRSWCPPSPLLQPRLPTLLGP